MRLFAAAALLLCFFVQPVFSAEDAKESAYERVMRTGVLRCGYGLEKPYTYKNLETGKVEGVFADYMEALAKNLSLKIEWAEEMGWGQFATALETGRVDAFCTVVGKTAGRARAVDYVESILYEPMSLIVRADDHRFDSDIEKLNDPSITFVGMEGQIETQILRERFPKAQVREMQQITADFSQVMMEVSSGKADAVLAVSSVFNDFNKKNPGKLSFIKGAEPLRLISEAIVVRSGEHTLRRMLDNATIEMLESGQIEKILEKYNFPAGIFFVPRPYEVKP